MSKEQKDIDASILKLRAIVKEKQEEIDAISNFTWKTSCSLRTEIASNTTGGFINIQTITDLNYLISLFGFLLQKKSEWDQSTKVLKVKKEFRWQNYELSAWEADFKNRLGQLEITRKKKDLKDLQVRLEALMSVEQRRAEEIKEIESLLEGIE